MKKILLIILVSNFITLDFSLAEIYKLNCKYTEKFPGNKNVKTSEWFISNSKKKIALSKINNKKVKFVSKEWDSRSYGVKDNKVFINNSIISINGFKYELGASSSEDGNEVLIGAFNETDLEKDPSWIKVQKDIDKIISLKFEKQKNKQNIDEIEKQYEQLVRLSDLIFEGYAINQMCSKPISVRVN